MLVKKVYADKGSRIRRRKWKLKHLDRQVDDDASSAGGDYEDFLEDLEEDPTIRQVPGMMIMLLLLILNIMFMIVAVVIMVGAVLAVRLEFHFHNISRVTISTSL